MKDHSDQQQAADSTRLLALLNSQTDKLHLELAKVQRDLVQVQHNVGELQAAQLLEANEQLLLAALRAETIAEAAVNNLNELTHLSQRDVLTDTPNRALMSDRLENALTMAQRRGTRVAVLFVDLDHFKQINDTLGHTVGDKVLQLVARRLESVVRDSDTVSRQGGDEFLVLLAEVSQLADVTLIAANMLAALAAPSHVDNLVLHLSASLGIAIYPEDGGDAMTLINRADDAMYRSKKQARGNFEFHPPDISGGRDNESSADSRGSAIICYDFTLPEPAPKDLHEANERLVIAAMSAQELAAHAEEARRRQIKFMAMVAHELQSPLTPIRTAAELLKQARTDELLLVRLEVVIKRQVAHMSRLVDDLLDESRVITGKFRLECSAVEIADILGVAVETCEAAISKKHQHLITHLPPGPLNVYGDPVRLTQIFCNLLDNASQYTTDGGEITLMAVLHDHTVAITVADNGIGIAAEVLPKIFDLFVQDERAPTLHARGLGIGLAVVYDLVEAHGGTIVARSPGANLGSEFVVTLPRLNQPG
ncbi:MAG: diguanylate cyclase domain-containing protein [Sulfuriferula sp.]